MSAASRRWAAACQEMNPRQGGGWAIVHKVTRHTVGMVTYFAVEAGQPPEINYIVAAKWRRKGLGAEAVGAAVSHLFGEVGLEMLAADVATDNIASINLLKGLGFSPVAAEDRIRTVGLDRLIATRWSLRAETWHGAAQGHQATGRSSARA